MKRKIDNKLLEWKNKGSKRMPLILDKNDIAVWIDPDSSRKTVNQLTKPYNENHMSAHTISKDISYASKNRNYPEIKDAVEYKEITQSDLVN